MKVLEGCYVEYSFYDKCVVIFKGFFVVVIDVNLVFSLWRYFCFSGRKEGFLEIFIKCCW